MSRQVLIGPFSRRVSFAAVVKLRINISGGGYSPCVCVCLWWGCSRWMTGESTCWGKPLRTRADAPHKESIFNIMLDLIQLRADEWYHFGKR